ncbi:MAG: stage V sporulation protein D, partial [Firmicutes bacterium]|nr:stage V sporulation protein D [Bacillota bacterium]
MGSRVARITVRRRILFLFLMLSFLLWGLGGRLAWLQLYKGAELRQRAQVQWTRDVPVEPKRGRIIDRNGKELALSASAPTVVAIPIEVRDPRSTAQALAKILELDPGYIERRLTTKAALVYVARKIDEGKAAQVRELA